VIPAALYTDAEHAAWDALVARQAHALAERRKGLGLPMVKASPIDDGVVLYRMEAKERKTEAGIIIPEGGLDNETDHSHPLARHGVEVTKQVWNQRVISLGLILDAGCRARDFMRSHGILVGDIIKFSKYSGEENSFHWLTAADDDETVGAHDLKDFLQIDVKDIHDSLDLWHRLHGEEPTMQIVYCEDTNGNGLHIVKPIVKEKDHG